MIWIYVALFQKCDECILLDYFDDIQNMKTIVEELIAFVSGAQIDDVDILVDFKEAIENIEVDEPDDQIMKPLLNIISSNYQNRDVEFK